METMIIKIIVIIIIIILIQVLSPAPNIITSLLGITFSNTEAMPSDGHGSSSLGVVGFWAAGISWSCRCS